MVDVIFGQKKTIFPPLIFTNVRFCRETFLIFLSNILFLMVKVWKPKSKIIKIICVERWECVMYLCVMQPWATCSLDKNLEQSLRWPDSFFSTALFHGIFRSILAFSTTFSLHYFLTYSSVEPIALTFGEHFALLFRLFFISYETFVTCGWLCLESWRKISEK